VQLVNLNFTRPTAGLAGCCLFNAPNGITVLTLATGKGLGFRSKTYHVEEVPSDIGGRAFQLTPSTIDTRANGEQEYHVLLAGRETTCSCAGFAYTGGCKHVSASMSLHCFTPRKARQLELEVIEKKSGGVGTAEAASAQG
jgi:hypothetical protein